MNDSFHKNKTMRKRTFLKANFNLTYIRELICPSVSRSIRAKILAGRRVSLLHGNDLFWELTDWEWTKSGQASQQDNVVNRTVDSDQLIDFLADRWRWESRGYISS